MNYNYNCSFVSRSVCKWIREQGGDGGLDTCKRAWVKSELTICCNFILHQQPVVCVMDQLQLLYSSLLSPRLSVLHKDNTAVRVALAHYSKCIIRFLATQVQTVTLITLQKILHETLRITC